MGLREAAEAARITRDDELAEKKRRQDEARHRREMERREQVEERAYDAAEEWGFAIDQHVWLTRPAPKGFTYLPVLLVCSDDGVWLEYSERKEYATSPIQPRFAVVDKCPSCENWLPRGSLAHDLAGIGAALNARSTVPAHHLREHGTEAP